MFILFLLFGCWDPLLYSPSINSMLLVWFYASTIVAHVGALISYRASHRLLRWWGLLAIYLIPIYPLVGCASWEGLCRLL